MSKWWPQLRSKTLYFIILGILWLLWELFKDELAGIIREHIAEGGVLMYGVTHPYIIMPSLLILFCIYTWFRAKRKIEIRDVGIKNDINVNKIDKDVKTLSITEGGERVTNKEKAFQHFAKYLELERKLWETRDKLPDNEDVQQNPEIKKAIFEIQVETNNIATLVNNREFDEFIEALLALYSRYLQFNMNPYEGSMFELVNRGHRKIRWYINHKIKD
jgi:hypothetical protein